MADYNLELRKSEKGIDENSSHMDNDQGYKSDEINPNEVHELLKSLSSDIEIQRRRRRRKSKPFNMYQIHFKPFDKTHRVLGEDTDSALRCLRTHYEKQQMFNLPISYEMVDITFLKTVNSIYKCVID